MGWLIEHGIGEDRALLIEEGQPIAARIRWPGELNAGQALGARLVARRAGATRGTARADDGTLVLVDHLPADASEGSRVEIVVTRTAVAERGRYKLAHGRIAPHSIDDPLADARTVRRFPPGLWEEIWTAASTREMAFAGGSLLFDPTAGMTVIDVDGVGPARDLALAAAAAAARAIRQFDIGGSIAIDFPTLPTKQDRQAVDAALERALADWPHERTAMNGFGLVQLVARLEGPSLIHRLLHHSAGAAARFLLRQAEMLEGAGAILLSAHPAVIAAVEPKWLAELERRSGRIVRQLADPALARGTGHAQIVER